MERIRWNLQWIADNAVLNLLFGLICFPVTVALAQVFLLILHGNALDKFPLEIWLLQSGIFTLGWSIFVVHLRYRRDRKQ